MSPEQITPNHIERHVASLCAKMGPDKPNKLGESNARTTRPHCLTAFDTCVQIYWLLDHFFSRYIGRYMVLQQSSPVVTVQPIRLSPYTYRWLFCPATQDQAIEACDVSAAYTPAVNIYTTLASLMSKISRYPLISSTPPQYYLIPHLI